MYRLARTFIADNVYLLALAVAGFAALSTFLLPPESVHSTSRSVLVWWTILCAVSVVNLGVWRASATALERQKERVDPAVYVFQRRQLLLSAVYVLGCGFRAIVPRADVQRIGLFDSWISSVMVGRSVATVAELCFMAQWALLLHKSASDAGCRVGIVIARLLVPLIAVAELCSWSAVLTTSYLGNVAEESIWAFSGGLLIVGGLALWSRCRARSRPFLGAALVFGVAYVTFMATVDIPMYTSRWLADTANGREYLSLVDGFWDVWARRNVTFAWEAWRTEIPWMSLYFSVVVWFSIALVHIPRFEPKPEFESAG